MIVDDFETIAINHARLFPSLGSNNTDNDDDDPDVFHTWVDFSDQEIADALAAFHELHTINTT